ncbi:MAG: hypothetical protein AAF539_11615 [Planctomycetota bacterium]
MGWLSSGQPWRVGAMAFVLLGSISYSRRVDAGLGPENIMVIVNGDNVDSLTIANHYVSIRSIPDSNVLVLSDVPEKLVISLEDFRERILRPVLSEINARKLAPSIRCIAYSAGFPTSVRITEHTQRLTDPQAKKYQTSVASLNSLTFFYQFILGDSHQYLGWQSNLYARGPFRRHFENPLRGEAGEEFQAASESLEAGKFEEAAAAFESLAKRYPSMSPLRIRAAEAYWQFENRLAAIEQLGLAIRSGWTNRRYLTGESALADLFDDATESSSDPLTRLLSGLQDLPTNVQHPVGFAANLGWASNGYPVPAGAGGVSYLLSVMLAIVHPNGSTVDQAIEVFRRGDQSDRTYPGGAVGFAKTSDVRTKTRFPALTETLAWLLARNRDVDIFTSRLPAQSKDYVGLILGTAKFDVSGRNWNLLPGSLADNLTSTGAVFQSTSQTKLTELLHAGAVMSSGTVTEPYSLPMKFPSPMMHPFYFEGTTAAEAFYLSTLSPYQLLIVGDPLAQPFARAPAEKVAITMDEAPDEGKRTIRISKRDPTPQSRPSRNAPIAAMEIYLQNRLARRIGAVGEIKLQVPQTTLGPIDCRVVLVGGHLTEPRIGFSNTFLLGDETKLPSIDRVSADVENDMLELQCRCPGAESIEVKHYGNVIATIAGNDGKVSLDIDKTGSGPVRLQAVGKKGDRVLVGPITTFDRTGATR